MGKFDEQIKEVMQLLARNVLHHMKEKGFTQASLAEAAGVSKRTVGYLVRPDERTFLTSSPTIDTLHKISTALGVEPFSLMADMSSDEVKAKIAFRRGVERAYQNRLVQDLADLLDGDLPPGLRKR